MVAADTSRIDPADLYDTNRMVWHEFPCKAHMCLRNMIVCDRLSHPTLLSDRARRDTDSMLAWASRHRRENSSADRWSEPDLWIECGQRLFRASLKERKAEASLSSSLLRQDVFPIIKISQKQCLPNLPNAGKNLTYFKESCCTAIFRGPTAIGRTRYRFTRLSLTSVQRFFLDAMSDRTPLDGAMSSYRLQLMNHTQCILRALSGKNSCIRMFSRAQMIKRYLMEQSICKRHRQTSSTQRRRHKESDALVTMLVPAPRRMSINIMLASRSANVRSARRSSRICRISRDIQSHRRTDRGDARRLAAERLILDVTPSCDTKRNIEKTVLPVSFAGEAERSSRSNARIT